MPVDDSEEIDLKALAVSLKVEGLPVQAVIAEECGVSQPTVSRATRNLIGSASPAAQKLWVYVQERLPIIAAAAAAEQSSVTPDIPRGETERQRRPGRARKRAPRLHVAAVVDAVDFAALSELPRDELAKLAERGLRDYLDDAFDPLLVIEQLSVLRRAQDPRRPLPGRR